MLNYTVFDKKTPIELYYTKRNTIKLIYNNYKLIYRTKLLWE